MKSEPIKTIHLQTSLPKLLEIGVNELEGYVSCYKTSGKGEITKREALSFINGYVASLVALNLMTYEESKIVLNEFINQTFQTH